MTLAVDSMVGAYRITGSIGEGAMGQVYRAVDERIGRAVAIKVLPRTFSSDPDRLRRFEQEARAAGMLNHPNLLTLFEFGSHDGAPFMVAELLEGETLRAALAKGPMRASLAVEIACAIAEGLAAAHDRGIVHRDLKPENVFITHEGRVKILDFGLAKFVLEGTSQHDDTAEWTAASTSGVVVGTAGYMAPEQIRGQTIDGRADIFSLGVILYEMLSGLRAFRKDSAVETMNAILVEDPKPLGDLVPDASPSLVRIVGRCLHKNRDQRYQSARDLSFSLAAFTSTSSTEVLRGAPLRVSRRWWQILIAAATALMLFAIGFFLGGRRNERSPAAPPVVRYLTFSGRDWGPAASPDGRTVAFTSTRDGTSRIWIKQIADGSEAALTKGPDLFPRFSPDGSSVLFTRLEGTQTSVWRAAVVGNEPRRIIGGARDGDFSPDGTRIAFLRRNAAASRQVSWELWIAATDGSSARRIHTTNEPQLHSPRWSPDGKELALIAEGDQVTARILLVSVEDGRHRYVAPAQARGVLTAAAWNRAGELVYSMSDVSASQSRGAGGSIYAHDVRSGDTRNLLSVPVTGRYVDVAAGRIFLDFNSSNQNLRESPIGAADRDGRWLTHGRSSDRQPVYSADGKQVVFSSDRGGNLDLWSISRDTAAIVRITDDPTDDWDPGFTADGKQLLWSSNRSGHFEIWTASPDGSDARQLSNDGADAENPTATADGQWIVYTSFHPEKRGLWRMRRDGSEATRIVPGRCLNPEVSPDGAYVAYHTDELNVRARIHVARVRDGSHTAFDVDVPAPVGASIGRTRWMPDGKAIAFIAPDERGRLGIYTQAFDPLRNLPESRRALTGFDRDDPSESFGIARDGSAMTVSIVDQVSGVMVVDGAIARR
jgi:eukaryotic-like serine/threonine-protein kinase